MFQANAAEPYSYSYARIFILKKEKNVYSFAGAQYDVGRNIFIENNFAPGDYVIVAELFWEQNITKEYTISKNLKTKFKRI